MNDLPDNETRIRILDAAEELFSRRGFAAVRLRDIAGVVGMRHASLYYYAPGGKEQLYVEVMERNLHRHRAGLTRAIQEAGSDLADQMRAVARWMASQPPLNLARMSHSDMPAIGEQQAERLMGLALASLSDPIVAALERARAAREVDLPDLRFAAMGMVALLQSIHAIPERYMVEPLERFAERAANMLLTGWLKR